MRPAQGSDRARLLYNHPMGGELPTTTTVLLDSLRDLQNRQAWFEFDARYRPVLIGFARALGLGDADAADAAQWTLAQFAEDYAAGRYRREKGRLSSWIMGIARHRIEKIRRGWGVNRGPAGGGGGGSDAQDVMDDEARLTQIWERQFEILVVGRAMESLRSEQGVDPVKLRAFELVALHDVPPEEAAKQCGMSVADVYVAKSRLSRKLREIVEALKLAYAEEE